MADRVGLHDHVALHLLEDLGVARLVVVVDVVVGAGGGVEVADVVGVGLLGLGDADAGAVVFVILREKSVTAPI